MTLRLPIEGASGAVLPCGQGRDRDSKRHGGDDAEKEKDLRVDFLDIEPSHLGPHKPSNGNQNDQPKCLSDEGSLQGVFDEVVKKRFHCSSDLKLLVMILVILRTISSLPTDEGKRLT